MSQSRKRYILENPDFRIKMSEAATKRFKEKNKWIFKGDKEKRISEQELSIYLNDGWCLGKKSNPAIRHVSILCM